MYFPAGRFSVFCIKETVGDCRIINSFILGKSSPGSGRSPDNIEFRIQVEQRPLQLNAGCCDDGMKHMALFL
jgi:hypothetical protein